MGLSENSQFAQAEGEGERAPGYSHTVFIFPSSQLDASIVTYPDTTGCGVPKGDSEARGDSICSYQPPPSSLNVCVNTPKCQHRRDKAIQTPKAPLILYGSHTLQDKGCPWQHCAWLPPEATEEMSPWPRAPSVPATRS